jgi:hypothetical protein
MGDGYYSFSDTSFILDANLNALLFVEGVPWLLSNHVVSYKGEIGHRMTRLKLEAYVSLFCKKLV